MSGVEITYQLQGLTGHLTHGPSGAVLKTTPPADNGGDGSSFSPTDLLAAALLSCAATTMALQAARDGLDFGPVSGRVVKQMVGPPRRVGELTVELTLPATIRPEHRSRLEAVAHECPVQRSLHPEVKLPMSFRYV